MDRMENVVTEEQDKREEDEKISNAMKRVWLPEMVGWQGQTANEYQTSQRKTKQKWQ